MEVFTETWNCMSELSKMFFIILLMAGCIALFVVFVFIMEKITKPIRRRIPERFTLSYETKTIISKFFLGTIIGLSCLWAAYSIYQGTTCYFHIEEEQQFLESQSSGEK